MSEIVLTLPDKIAKEAEDLGLLKPALITSMIKEEIRRRKVNRLFATMDKLSELPDPPTEEEIAEEIESVRKERRRS